MIYIVATVAILAALGLVRVFFRLANALIGVVAVAVLIVGIALALGWVQPPAWLEAATHFLAREM